MNDSIKVSVIIAAYNVEKYIGECLDDIIGQTHQNFEIIICDDCSSDMTASIIKNYQKKDNRIIYIKNQENLYAAQSRNNCFNIATGEYYMIQDADDRADPCRIETLLNTIVGSEYDFVSSGQYLFDEEGVYKKYNPKKEVPTSKDFLSGLPFCHAATMFKKSCILAVGGYRVSDETRCGQDYDLFFRLFAAGFIGINIQPYLYGYRVDRNTIARRKFKYRIDECKIRLKGYKALGLLPIGYLYCVKPIIAYFVQKLKGNRG